MENSQILKYDFQIFPNQSYYFDFHSSDGQTKQEFGNFVDINGAKVLHIIGSYQYVLNNKIYSFKYTADPKGKL